MLCFNLTYYETMTKQLDLCEFGTLICETRELALTPYDFDLIIIICYCQRSEELTQLLPLAKSTLEKAVENSFTFFIILPVVKEWRYFLKYYNKSITHLLYKFTKHQNHINTFEK